ncbi:microtubule-associated tumor suppressor 1 isoform X1 [Labeo rohita]|uniref:Microtubule-associated tumor suppressor 1 isoform X1 n=1 Tax=Labeo rohita TaxID=84645 RepID=A0A498NG09_LABRO|nr:microtubule-associated tumor suppressor 1 isoform X1 [Labeo rohita]RXN30677.1 microtubule-associated tumor suppressor 1 isoform X1 [Labeo rohita]
MELPTNKSELPSPALPKRPSQESQHGMRLALLSSEQSNNAFTSESPLSSSSTLLLYDRGETSPDSMRSLSSLSSARTDSPLDVDMPEVEMGKATASSDDSGIQSPDCRPDYSEDNDNSVSVYLDANEDCWSDNDNNNVTLVVTQKVGQTDGDDTSLCSSESTDDDTKEDEEEDSFLSLASVELIMKSQVGVSDLEVSTSSEEVTSNSILPPAEVSNMAVVNERRREVAQEKEEVELSSAIQETDVMDETENAFITDTKNTTSHSFIPKEDNQPKSTGKKPNDPEGRVFSKPPTRAALTKATKPEIKRFPRPDLRNVKAKIISRAASAPRSANPATTTAHVNVNQSASGSVKVHASRKVENKAVGKRSRSSSNHMRGNETKVLVSGGQEKDVNTLSFLMQGEETMKSEYPLSTDFKDEEEPQLEKETGEENSKSTSKTVSSKLGPSLGTNSTSTSGPSETRLKPSNREARPTGSLGPPGGRAVQPAGIPRMRSTVPCSPTSVSSTSCKGPQKATSSKLPVKGLPTSPSSSSLGSTISESNNIAVNKVPAEGIKSEEKSIKQSLATQNQGKSLVSKPVSGHRSRASSTPSKSATGLKAPAVTSHVTAKTNQNVLQRTGSARLTRSSSAAVDKSSKGPKAAGATAGRTQQHSSANQGGPTEEEEEKDLRLQNDKKSQCILQLRKLIANGNRRLEALALVVQHIFSERDVAIKQREELSVQINSLREQLGNSISCCEQLEREKEGVRVSLEALFQKLQEQHQTELQQLEERLKEFYSAEWDKTHEAYQREADKCRALMQQQVEDVRSKQEALRSQQEVAHAQQIATLKQEHEASLAELRKTHEQDMQELDKTLKESEAMLNEKIQTLTAENEALKERLREEEERRRALADKSLKDAHTLYLEQELESLRAVLEIKTNQIHQQDKKLMQMDKLIDDNLKLEECLKKVQQENEDYKARMDKHAALSKQLSTEQAMLQQTLQKESKVNKRLSMENEELLWKLHNGDLCSPRRLSPSSPFQSPRNSASFPTTPVSPR